MNADELRALQAPLKQNYRDNPDAAVITLRARGEATDGLSPARSRPAARSSRRACTPPPAATARWPAPATCCSKRSSPAPASRCARSPRRSASTCAAARVRAEGDLDFRGTLGVDQGRAGRLPRHPAALRSRYRRAGEQLATCSADRALLRRAADAAAGADHQRGVAGSSAKQRQSEQNGNRGAKAPRVNT